MTDAKARSEWAKARRARRRTIAKDATADAVRLDRRATRKARFRKEDVHLYLTPEAVAVAKAVAARWDYGRGTSLSAFIESLIRRYTFDSPEAKEARRMWKEAHEGEP